MNCDGFQKLIYEYLDGTLDTEVLASARAHLRQCGDCQAALAHETALAQTVHNSLDRAASELSLRPETKRAVVEMWESSHATSPSWMRAWRWLMAGPFRTVGAGAVLLATLALFLGMPDSRRSVGVSTLPSVTESRRGNWVIDVPIQIQSRQFHLQGNEVLDAVSPSVAVGHARYVANSPYGP